MTTFIANKSKIKRKGHLNCSITQPGKTDLSPHSLLLGDITQERTSVTLHIDNVKNISAIWPLALIKQQSSQILIVKIYTGTVNPS